MLGFRKVWLVSFLVVAAVSLPAPVGGQVDCRSMAECPATQFADPDLRDELTFASVNALLGGVTAAAGRLFRGEPLWAGFWHGALGGGLAYAGKRIAVERFYGAGLVGRQVASTGGSIVRNASRAHGLLEEIVLPAGPVRLYISDGGVRARLDLATVIASGAFMAAYGARLDGPASLSAGALIFRGDSPMPGLTSAGAMVVWSDMPAHEGPRLMAHERVHILQYDQMFLSWGEELERWAAEKTLDRFRVSDLLEYVDPGIAALGIRTGLAVALDYRTRPWETEAYFLAQRAYPVAGSLGDH